MKSPSIVLASVSVLLFSGPAWAEKFKCSGAQHSPYDLSVPAGYEHSKYAPAGDANAIIRASAAYTAHFDSADDDNGDGSGDFLAVPEFVTYELKGLPEVDGHHDEPDISIDRPSKWYKDDNIWNLVTENSGESGRLDDSYRGIGTLWNRGHLAMADHAQRISAKASCNTHYLLNAIPQAAKLNQGPWLHFENYTAAASNKFGRLWIIAGPIFEQGAAIATIGDDGEVSVAIPDAVFKVAFREVGTSVEYRAIIYPQPREFDQGQNRWEPSNNYVKCSTAASSSSSHTFDHRPFLVSLMEVEAQTGLQFFADDHGTHDRLIAEPTPTSLWPVEEKFWDRGFICGGQRFVN